MGKAKAAEKGSDKGGATATATAKGKGGKGKGDNTEEKGGKVKGAQQINVRHILVGVSLSTRDGRQQH